MDMERIFAVCSPPTVYYTILLHKSKLCEKYIKSKVRIHHHDEDDDDELGYICREKERRLLRILNNGCWLAVKGGN